MVDAAPARNHSAATLAYRLAAVVARPLDAIDPDTGGLEPLSVAATRAIAQNPHFRGPMNRAVAGTLGLFDLALDAEQLERFAESEHPQLAVALVADDLARVREAATQLAAAIVHKRALAFTLKAERERVRAAFGEESYRIATREVPMLHAGLTELDIGNVDVLKVAQGAEDPATFAKRLTGFGFDALSAFVQRTAPGLSSLFRFRCPAQAEPAIRDRLAHLIADTHCEHIVKLNRRRFQPWLATTG